MSSPIRTLAINSKTEDFPTPVSPTRRIVYGAFALFFDVLMIPFLRDSTSLENKIKHQYTNNVVETYLIVGVLYPSSRIRASSSSGRAIPAWSSRIVDRLIRKVSSMEEPFKLVVVRGSDFLGKTHTLGWR